jgi:hypothetical protein
MAKGKFEDTRMVIRSGKSKGRQYNGQMKKGKRANYNVQNTINKIKETRATRTLLKTGDKLRCSGSYSRSVSYILIKT